MHRESEECCLVGGVASLTPLVTANVLTPGQSRPLRRRYAGFVIEKRVLQAAYTCLAPAPRLFLLLWLPVLASEDSHRQWRPDEYRTADGGEMGCGLCAHERQRGPITLEDVLIKERRPLEQRRIEAGG